MASFLLKKRQNDILIIEIKPIRLQIAPLFWLVRALSIGHQNQNKGD